MSSDVPALEINNLFKTFYIGFLRRRVEALRGVSFSVMPGEIFGLLGPNGAGKTTAIKIAMELIRASSGSVRIFGSPSGRHAARADIGYLPEGPYFHEYLKPTELLAFHGKLAGLNRTQIKERSEELLIQVGLQDALKRPLRKFSKGMLQRLGLAQALISRPKFLLLDEPMSGLDPLGRKFVVDLIKKQNEAGTTIMFSSHILTDVERLCDRVVILNQGKKVAEGDIATLVKNESDVESFEDLFVRKALETDESRSESGNTGV
jgi:ABC-2 type transport system ATP-binding protein